LSGGDCAICCTGLALLVPLCSALVWVLMQVTCRGPRPPADLSAAVLIGAVLSAAVSLPLAWPLRASAYDLQLLSLLGVVNWPFLRDGGGRRPGARRPKPRCWANWKSSSVWLDLAGHAEAPPRRCWVAACWCWAH
jgi:hypothetical protein